MSVLDAKWLDPECDDGCRSLLLKHQVIALAKDRDLIKSQLTASQERVKELVKLLKKSEPFMLSCLCAGSDGHRKILAHITSLRAELDKLKGTK